MAKKKGGVLSLKDVDRVFSQKKVAELEELKSRGSTQRNRPVIASKMGAPADLSPREGSRPSSPFGRGKRRKTRRRR